MDRGKINVSSAQRATIFRSMLEWLGIKKYGKSNYFLITSIFNKLKSACFSECPEGYENDDDSMTCVEGNLLFRYLILLYV